MSRLSLVRNPMTRVVAAFKETRKVANELRQNPADGFAPSLTWLHVLPRDPATARHLMI